MISYIRGYYIVEVEGINPELFLNYLIRNKVSVYNVKKINSTKIEFYIDKREMKKMKKLYRGSKFEIKVKQKTGIPFIIKRIYKQKSMWSYAIVSLIVLMLLSQFITDIYIDAPEGIDKEQLKAELYDTGLKPGVVKRSIDRKEIRDNIMTEFDNVAYVSINVKGTNVFVTVTKKSEEIESNEKSNYCNIIAEKNGIIESVIPRSGDSIVTEKQIVLKGEELVIGCSTKSIPEVWANTTYESKQTAPYISNEKEKTGEYKNIYTLKFYDKEYILRKNIKYKDYVIEKEEYKLTLGNYTFPLRIEVNKFCEVKEVSVTKDKEILKQELKEKAKKELEYLMPASAKIINIEHNYKVNKNILEYTIVAQVSENIAKVHSLSRAEAEQIIKSRKEVEGYEEKLHSNPQKRPVDDIRNEFESPKETEDKDINS